MRPIAVQVRVLTFGPWKHLLPEEGAWCQLPVEGTVADLLRSLEEEGRFEPQALRSAAVAVNEVYAAPSLVLQDGDEMAILPPVSGGSEPSRVALVTEPIDTEAVIHALKAGEDGAVCIFDGIVRNNTRGRQTLYLDYEAYPGMAMREMLQLRQRAIEQFGVREVAIVHRLGRLGVGETSIFIAVASAHRGAAFDACRWVIDTLKKTVPIWKHEHFTDGSVWPAGEPFPDNLAETAR